MVRKWVRAFKDGRTNVHDEEQSGRPSVITDDLIQKVDNKVKENRRFKISSLADKFPAVSRSVLYEIVSERLNYRKLFTTHLAGKRHSNDEEVKTFVQQWLSSLAASFYDDSIQKLVPRYDKRDVAMSAHTENQLINNVQRCMVEGENGVRDSRLKLFSPVITISNALFNRAIGFR
ncbi:hypothetical protein J6590_060629 [Homalodisca vitripennis]|nr:hypothetical protein J6590_060629 [Homalodisca vitripennis]